MAELKQNFEAGTNGVEITTANSGGTGNTAVATIKGTGASVAFTNLSGEAIAGMSAKAQGPAAAAGYVNASVSGTQLGCFIKMRLPAVTATTAIHVIRGTAKLAQVQLLTTGKLQFENANASQTYVTPSALALPGVYWIDVAVDSGTTTTDGKMKFVVRDSAGALAGGMTAPVEWTATNTGAGIAASFFQYGKANASNETQAFIADDQRVVTGVYDFAQPASTVSIQRPTSIVANAGAFSRFGTATTDYGAISDTDEATGLRSPDNPSSTTFIAGVGGTLAAGDITVKVKASKTGGAATGKIELLDSANNVIAAGTNLTLSEAVNTYDLVLTTAQNTAVTSRTGLRVRFTANVA